MKMHPLRQPLHNEIHARPPESVQLPTAITHVVMWLAPDDRARSLAHLCSLLADHHLASPQPGATHMRADFGAFRLRWEMHTEFVSYTFMRDLPQSPVAGGDAGAGAGAGGQSH